MFYGQAEDFFVRKWMLLLGMLLFLDVGMIGNMKDATSLDALRRAGMPVKVFEAAGMGREEMEKYLPFWKDLHYFPVAFQREQPSQQFYFQDTWKEIRTFGGERVHEGCDIFGEEDKREYYPVVSITDGKVEKVGWLPLGGWRIGIRSPGGGFFYYAHLSSYAKKFQEGESVKAGEILGFLGDTGYGSEGTSGKFPCHLHLGIYVRTKDKEEDPLNPYPVLCFLKKRQKNFFY